MKLAIFNGSPRGQKSNSKILTEQFLAGYRSKNPENSLQVCFLSETKKLQEHLHTFLHAEIVIIIFPLYTDCMPGIVKAFFEQIHVLEKLHNKKLGFIVQSGFPEAIHSMYVERYLKKFTEKLGCYYLGTIIKGGVEGIQVMPPPMTKKLFKRFHELGKFFAETGTFSPTLRKKLMEPIRMSKIRRMGFSFFKLTGLTDFYWNSQLKKNGAYQRRFDKPFV